jgi:glycosyltransferase 2 family protein
MSAAGGRRWILTTLRWALCAVAIGYLVWKVPWRDRVTLSDGSRVRLIAEGGDHTYVIERNGRQETIREGQVAKVANGELPDVEYGISTVVRRMRLDLALLAILIFGPVPFFSALRLVWMLRVQGLRLPLWESIKLTFAGNFFNFALPGTTGGDIYKAYHIARIAHRKTEAVTTVFLDRVIGLLSLVLMSGAMMVIVWRPNQFGAETGIIGVVVLGLAIGAMLVFSKRVRTALRLTQIAQRLPMGEQLLRVGRAIVAMRQHKARVLGSLGLALTLQIIVVISAIFMAR